jgi:hypothetical protein
MAKIPDGHYVVADIGYRGEYDVIRIENSLDDNEVALFKSNALARHENFNSRVKRYGILLQCYRGKGSRGELEKHRLVFNALVCICQLEMMHGSTLFEV